VLGFSWDYELRKTLPKTCQPSGKAGSTTGRKEPWRVRSSPVVHGNVSFPRPAHRYANRKMDISRFDVDLAPGHYHAGHLEKAPPAFNLRPSEDADGLRLA